MQQLQVLLKPSSSSRLAPLVDTDSSTHNPRLIDSGVSHHMTGNLSLFLYTHDISLSPVGLPDGLQTMAIKSGTVSLTTGITLYHVLYALNLTVNLIYVSRLASNVGFFYGVLS